MVKITIFCFEITFTVVQTIVTCLFSMFLSILYKFFQAKNNDIFHLAYLCANLSTLIYFIPQVVAVVVEALKECESVRVEEKSQICVYFFKAIILARAIINYSHVS